MNEEERQGTWDERMKDVGKIEEEIDHRITFSDVSVCTAFCPLQMNISQALHIDNSLDWIRTEIIRNAIASS